MSGFQPEPGACSMKALADLFSTDYGLFSLAVLAFIPFMAYWFYRFFSRKMDESARENP